MGNLEKALIGASLMNTILFTAYKPNELNKHGELIWSRVGKFLRSRSKKNKNLYVEAVMKTDKAWRKAIVEFANTKIEAKTTLARIYDYFNEDIQKFAKISDEHLENFLVQATDDAEAEHNSGKIMDFLAKELDLEVKKSLFSGKKAIIKGNIITDGKQVKEGF